MDIYLPADFHRLHDDVITDWRDASSSETTAQANAAREDKHSVDPDWVAL